VNILQDRELTQVDSGQL